MDKRLIILGLVALFIGLGVGGSLFRPAIERNDLLQISTPVLDYGQPLQFSLNTPAFDKQISPYPYGKYGCPDTNRKILGLAAVSLTDAIIHIDGVQYSPSAVCNFGGGSACILLNVSAQFVPSDAYSASSAQNWCPVPNHPGDYYLCRPGTLAPSVPLASFSTPQYLSAGSHILQIYWKGTPGSVWGQCGSFVPTLNEYNRADSEGFDSYSLVAQANFSVKENPNAISCNGTLSNGVCIVPAASPTCAPGQLMLNNSCVYPATQPPASGGLSTYQPPTTPPNTQNVLLGALPVLIVIGGAAYLLKSRRGL